MKKVIVCVNYRANPNQPSCAARGSEEIAQCIETEVVKRNLAVCVERFNCLGQCERGPNVRLAPDGKFFNRLGKQDLPALMLEIEQFSRD
jgi:NADH:ubiquinone oxidoreductase subunit E